MWIISRQRGNKMCLSVTYTCNYIVFALETRQNASRDKEYDNAKKTKKTV